MKVLLVIDTYETNNNGTSISAQRYAEELRRRGHEVKILCADEQPAEDRKNVRMWLSMDWTSWRKGSNGGRVCWIRQKLQLGKVGGWIWNKALIQENETLVRANASMKVKSVQGKDAGEIILFLLILQISSGCQEPFVDCPGNVVWCDNIRLVY